MRKQEKGLATALLIVLILTGGCEGRSEVYTSGLSPSGDENEAEESGSEAGLASYDGTEDASGSRSGTVDAADWAARGSGMADPADAAVKGQGTESETVPASGGEAQSGGADAEAADDGGPSEAAGYVYVCGAVQNPGVYPMTEGMRIYEAIALAGGFTEEADEEWLNQAELLWDGQRLYVYSEEETQQMDYEAWAASAQNGGNYGNTGALAAAATDVSGKINLNTADRTALMTLPGIGEAKADAIIAYREQQGAFGTIEEIQNVAGIKSAVYSKIKDLITV